MADNRGPTPGATNTSPVAQTPVTEVYGTPGDGKVVQWNATTQRLEWGASSGASVTPAATYTYYADGSIQTATAGGVTLTYTYNADGSIATESDGTTTRTFAYNTDGTLASVA